ncbi:MAG: hypothetical protein NT116_02540, partial [Candidatus Parcubacteria bacterium]|nr:hypothetical protein [Candidatus Parcubacteria bacterium]
PIKQANKDENEVNDLIADLDKMKKELKDKQEELEQKENEQEILKNIPIRIEKPFIFPKKPKKDITDYTFNNDTWKKYPEEYPEPREIKPIKKTKNPFKIRKVTYQNITKSTS